MCLFALYSTVTRLAYTINERYYRGSHFVWCAPAPSTDALVPRNPPSSDPWHLFDAFKRDIGANDRHSWVIERNRTGLTRGAASKQADGVISEDERRAIEAWVEQADLEEFQPLFMVIPYNLVVTKGIVETPEIRARARPSSNELIIRNLPRGDFEVWS
jgi:hypothetical protein